MDTEKYHPKNDEEALNYAVFGKSTKDIPESRGFGISTSIKMLVKGLKGKIFILSGKAFLYQNFQKQEIIKLSEKHYYKGCYIAIRLPMCFDSQFNFYDYIE